MSEETKTGSGKHFDLDMTIGEAMAVHPRVREVMAVFHLGGCAHCAINQVETLGQVFEGYGVASEELLGALESVVAEA